MDSVKALAETNMQISEAKNILFRLQSEETDYLVSREKKVMDRIDELYQTSKTTLDEIQNNYVGAYEILQMASENTKYLKESYSKFQVLISDFSKRNEAWEEEVSKQEERFTNIKKGLNVDTVKIANDRKSIELEQLKMVQDRRKIADDRGTLERAFARLNKNNYKQFCFIIIYFIIRV